MERDDEPFGVNACLVVDVQVVSAVQFVVGACLWQPRRTSREEDARPLAEKRSAPSFSISAFEFREDSDNFLNLDSLVVREKPRWCFLNPKLSGTERHKIEELLERSGVGVAMPSNAASAFKWPRSDQKAKQTELEGELAVALNVEDLKGHCEVMALTSGLNALASLMAELRPLGLLTGTVGAEANGLSEDSTGRPMNTVHELKLGRLDSCMRLDSAAAEAIMLLPDRKRGSSGGNASGSLFGVLNHTKTAMGARLLESWLRQPLVDLAAISARHDLVGCFKANASLRGDLGEALKNAPDLSAIVAKLRRFAANAQGGGQKGRAATLTDVYKLYHFSLRNLPAFQVALEAAPAAQDGDGGESGVGAVLASRFKGPLAQCDADLVGFKQLVEHVLDLSCLPEMRIKAEHRPELVELAAEMAQAERSVTEVHDACQEEWARVKAGGRGQIRLEAHKEEGFVMRLPQASDEQLLRKEVPQVTILSILKSGVVFTTAELREAASRHLDASARYGEEQRGVVEQVVATAATYAPVAEAIGRLVSELDVLLSFAHVAAHCPGGDYVRPTFVTEASPGGERVSLLGARHPCVELQEGVAFIANDYEFFRDASRFQIVTGPNMGGKSTYIRGLGSLVAMAQAGAFVPCSSATLPLVDAILARVGAGDSQARGLSTFMAEMLEASTIVRTATAASLVIIDELGRGTSTFDGFGLAWAISTYMLTEIKCWTIFATHFHELTALETDPSLATSSGGRTGVVNRHVAAHVDPASDEVTFLYEVQKGACLQSYGVHVAKMAHFPKSVVACAAAKAAELEGFVGVPAGHASDPAAKRVKLGNGSGGGSADTNRKLVGLVASTKALPLDMGDATRAAQARSLASAAGLL